MERAANSFCFTHSYSTMTKVYGLDFYLALFLYENKLYFGRSTEETE